MDVNIKKLEKGNYDHSGKIKLLSDSWEVKENVFNVCFIPTLKKIFSCTYLLIEQIWYVDNRKTSQVGFLKIRLTQIRTSQIVVDFFPFVF